MTEEVQDALQKRDIDELRRTVVEGFAGVHKRQDETNGKVLRNISDITELQKFNLVRIAENRYNKLIWYVLTGSLTIIATLISYIIFTLTPHIK